jgi:hypothetical protein
MSATQILERAIDAYGGEARWREIDTIDARATCGGLLFNWKRGGGFDNVEIKVKVWEPWARLAPVDSAGSQGILSGHGVRIESPAGELLAERPYARDGFPYGRRLFRWDLVDVVYFTAYAFWNYLTLPALLIRDDIRWEQLDETTLEANFPDWIPTHSRKQQFRFDPDTGLLEKYDYTAEVFGSWAKATHVLGHASADGVLYVNERHIRPHVNGKPAPFPLLIHAVVHDYRPHEAPAAAVAS